MTLQPTPRYRPTSIPTIVQLPVAQLSCIRRPAGLGNHTAVQRAPAQSRRVCCR